MSYNSMLAKYDVVYGFESFKSKCRLILCMKVGKCNHAFHDILLVMITSVCMSRCYEAPMPPGDDSCVHVHMYIM